MDVTDPRERYDDLLIGGDEADVDAETFEDHRSMEAYQSGWAAGALALDGEGRALLAYHGEDDTWMAPGGALQPGETLTDGLKREIREETGIEVEPLRPHAVNVWTVRHGGRSASFRFVLFEARPATTEVGDDLDAADGEITDAGWFETLPGNTLHREQTRSVLQRCRDG